MVESPAGTSAAAKETSYKSKLHFDEKSSFDEKTPEDEPLLEEGEAEIPTVSPTFITSSIRGTLRHVRRGHGTISLFWGFLPADLYAILFSVLMSLFPPAIPVSIFASIAIALLLAPIHLAATHAILGAKLRVPPVAVWKHLVAPTLLHTFAANTVFLAPMTLFHGLGLSSIDRSAFLDGSCAAKTALLFKVLAVPAVSLVLFVVMLLPSMVVLARVEASLLPSDAQTIVPVDRTFGGLAVPVPVKGDEGRVVVRGQDAVFTLSGALWVRLVRLGVKLFAVDLSFWITSAVVVLLVTLAVAHPTVRQAYVLAQQMGGTASTNL